MKREAKVQRELRDYLERAFSGIITLKVEKFGYPDLLLLRNGKAAFVEVKRNAKGYGMTEVQQVRFAALRDSNMPCYLYDASAKDALTAITDFVKRYIM